MISKRGIVLALALLFLAAGSARADWQYTRWGMTREEVIAASHGAAEAARPAVSGEKPRPCVQGDRGEFRTGPPGGWAGALARYEAGRFRFLACFYFDKAGKLGAVELIEDETIETVPAQLYDSLFQKYGKPEREERSWHLHDASWRSGGDDVNFFSTEFYGLAQVIYRPVATAESGGL